MWEVLVCNSGSHDLSTQDVYNSYAHLTQARYFANAKESDTRNKIKAWIHSYGGVSVSVNGGGNIIDNYNFEDNCTFKLCSSSNSSGNGHTMVIVGWDDNFPAESFYTSKDPDIKPGNGAWLVKNSWNPYGNEQDIYGSELFQDATDNNLAPCSQGSAQRAIAPLLQNTPFSSMRYFWLSYDSPDANNFLGIAYENKDYFDNIYQYDGYQKDTEQVKPSKAANIFTIKNPDDKTATDNTQKLKCVGFEIHNNITAPANYTVEIYRNIPNGGSPTDGTLAYTTTGICSEKGIYTVEVKEPVVLAQGERYSVVVTLENTNKENTDNNPTISVEHNENKEDPQSDHIGESFIFEPGTNSWVDLARKEI